MSQTMQAVQIRAHGGPEVMEVVELPVPDVGAGQVLIKVTACGVMFNDLMMRNGFHPHLPPLPMVLGSEVVGIVLSIGEGVDPTLVGRRVAAALPMGGYASRAVAQASTLLFLPDDVSDTEGLSLLINAPTALVMLEDVARIQPGQSLLVTAAAGAVGQLLLSAGKAMGAGMVIGASSAAKVGVVREKAHHAIDYSRDDWPDAVMALTGGIGVDHVFESVGGQVGTAAMRCLSMGGTMVQYGLASGLATEVSSYETIARGLSYVGFGLMHFPPLRWHAASMKAIELHRQGLIDLKPTWKAPLANARDAHLAISGRSTFGKLVLMVD